MLLRPDSDVWGQGEVDVAGGGLDRDINSYEHCTGSDPSTNCGCSLDGVKPLTSTDVPADPLHLVMQGFACPGAATSAPTTVQVDWVSIWTAA